MDCTLPERRRALRGTCGRIVIVGALLILSPLVGAPGGNAQNTPAAPSPVPTISAAPSSGAPSEDAQHLRERAAEFWAARVAGDINKQWQLLEPRGQGRMTAAEYASNRGAVKYLAYQVEDATVTGYFGTVNVRLLIQPMFVAPGRGPAPPSAFLLPDKWVKVRGTWYHTLDETPGSEPTGGPR
jgi:hypothetical protein